MTFARLYSGGDGQSHFEDLDASPNSALFSTMQPATGILFKNDPSPHILEWHPAPRRQYCITLAGSVEIRIGDGTARTFVPGDVFLAEDVTGRGHIAVPSANWTRVFVAID